MKHNKNRSGKLVIITEGEHKDCKGKIYNNESPKDGVLSVYLNNGTNISIPSYKCQIEGYFD